jgi:HK97 family phage major capsid protein
VPTLSAPGLSVIVLRMVRSEWSDHAKACGVDLNSPEFSLKLMGQAPRNEEELRQRIRDNITYRATTPQSTTAAAGGNTIADDNSLMTSLEATLLAHSGARQVSRVVRTENGSPLPVPLVSDVANSAVLLTESSSATVASIDFGLLTLGAYKFNSLVLASFEIHAGRSHRLECLYRQRTWRANWARHRTVLHLRHGLQQPTGQLKNATSVAKSTDGLISYKSIVKLVHAVDSGYRASPNFAVQCSDGVYSELRQIVSSDGVPVWSVNVAEGAPDKILGVPININNDMVASSTVAASAIIAAGDFSRHIIRDVADVRITRLTERYAIRDQVAFTANFRTDSGLTVSSTVAAASQPIKALKTT